jgi:hypothetical protein
MKKNAESFLNKTLGSDFLESLGNSLKKSEVYKQGTRTITDTNDLFQGLQIVPRTLLNLLVRELSTMQIDDIKEIYIPGQEDTFIRVSKLERDSYSGQVFQKNVKINDFLHRSLPGIGLVLMTVLELYNFEDLEQEKTISPDKHAEINRIIDERLNLHSLVNKVVDGKMQQKDAIQQLLMARLTEEFAKEKKKNVQIADKKEPEFIDEPKVIKLIPKKKLPLSDFVESRKKKLGKKEHFIQMQKSEQISCPDCGNVIFSAGAYSGCICFGSDDKKLYIKKSEGGIKVRAGRGWDAENLEMLLEVLRRKNA